MKRKLSFKLPEYTDDGDVAIITQPFNILCFQEPNGKRGNRRSTVEWGFWRCPQCGAEHTDPGYITATTCENGHSVFLSEMDDNNQITAIINTGA